MIVIAALNETCEKLLKTRVLDKYLSAKTFVSNTKTFCNCQGYWPKLYAFCSNFCNKPGVLLFTVA